MRETTWRPAGDKTEPAIANVGDLPVEILFDNEDSVLSRLMHRVIEELGRPTENYAAHGTTPTP